MVDCINQQTRPSFLKKNHIRCSANIINLVIQEGPKKANDYIFRIREVLLYINSSGPKVQSYEKMYKNHGSIPKKFDIDTKHR